jgi:hypothetical protein
MIQTIGLSDFRTAFHNMGRKDQFSYEALELIFDYIEEYESDTGETQELDVIGICCEWNESTPAEIIDQYDTDINTEGMDDDEIAAAVYEWLSDETIVAGTTSAGDLVYVQF